MHILVIDGQGGNLGRELIRSISERFPDVTIHAVGTNSAATMNMLKNSGITAATGENAVSVACRNADIIVGPVGIVLADAAGIENESRAQHYRQEKERPR